MSTPFFDDEIVGKWARRKDLSQFWLDKIKWARNEEDWRGALTYVYQCYLEAAE